MDIDAKPPEGCTTFSTSVLKSTTPSSRYSLDELPDDRILRPTCREARSNSCGALSEDMKR